jgi:hypothetical protein
LTLNSIAHSNFELLSSQLISKILPRVYAETAVSPSLIRSVDFGPFKHQVDDGLPLRKAAFLCMETFMDVASNRIIASEFVESLKLGFSDENDIQQLCFSILSKFASKHPKGLLEVLDELPESIMKSLKQQLKHIKSSENDQSRAILRSAMHSLALIRGIPGFGSATRFVYLLERVAKTPSLSGWLDPPPL